MYKFFFLGKIIGEVKLMKRRKLRSYVIPTLILFLAFGVYVTYATIESNKRLSKTPDNHVNDTITRKELPVINQVETAINPYLQADVTIGKNFYDYKGSEEDQEKSITRYEDTYIQNTGIDYVAENTFEVISILSGEVIEVKEDDTLGKTVKVQHQNSYVSTYQSLSEVSVKKGDKVTQGQVLGKSGTNKMEKDLGNHLHFELSINNQMVNPTEYLNKNLNVSSKEE